MLKIWIEWKREYQLYRQENWRGRLKKKKKIEEGLDEVMVRQRSQWKKGKKGVEMLEEV